MDSINAATIQKDLRKLGDPSVAEHCARFFKTAKGEHGEGDRFLGIRVPVIRKAVRRYRDAHIRTTLSLLKSRYHEERLLAALMLVDQFSRGDQATRKSVYDAYLAHTRWLNNCDIIDSSAHKILGPCLENRSRRVLYKLVESKSLWESRIAMMTTYHFIRLHDFDDALAIAEALIDDDHDLIHKASGWMLREVGNRDLATEENFLKQHYRTMPRTMLRYAIEKFPEQRRKAYLKGEI